MNAQNFYVQFCRRTARRYPFLRRFSVTTIGLILVWTIAIYTGERSTFASHITSCAWESWEEWPQDAAPHRLVFVSDPQLVDPHTYPGRPWPLSSLTEFFTDKYMARNFRLINRELDPDSIVFLGDLFDGGREWRTSQFISGEQGRWKEYGTSQWTLEYNRFGKIFFAPEQLYPRADRAITAARDRKIKTNLPGNHDLGFGTRVQIPVRDRFEAHYGDTNTVYVIANHTFISLDTPSLSAADEMTDPEHKQQARLEHVWQPANDFLNKLDAAGPKVVAEALNEYFPTARPSQGFSHEVFDPKEASRRPTADKHTAEPRLPLVLLTHVPLFRPDGDHCGSQRERGRAIPISHGYQYQNVLTPGLSSTIARKISETGDLVHVFSGDDHDYCDLVHRFNVKPWIDGKIQDKPVMKAIREITVKSFSWAMGVRRPGFQLVSMWNPVDAQGISIGGTPTTIQTHLCLLPDQLSIFINYGLLLGVTLVVLIVRGVVLSLRKPDA
ncbi:cell division control protein 1, partial [Zymoseptoria tritici IPO323]